MTAAATALTAAIGHWLVAPIVLPLAAGLLLLLLAARGPLVQRVIGIGSTLALLVLAAWLVGMAAGGGHGVYRLGDWPAPMAIVLVLDRLSALMLLLTDIVAVGALLYAAQGTDRRGRFFHPLFQLQLAGLHGAFLTGDLFNLFVFFEVLLIASYSLLLYGGGRRRLRAGLHYVVLNLAGSTLFLIAVGLLYSVTGALNMADLSVQVARVPASDAALVRTAGLLLMVVFALKAALLPLYFWLPRAYTAASGPVAAIFALMTKVGVYAIIRVSTLIFGSLGGAAGGLAAEWLVPVALATQLAGVLGALAARDLRRLQSYLLIMSVGVMLAGVGLYTERGLAAALFYLSHSTIITAAMFLLVDLVARQRGPIGARLRPAPPVTNAGVLGTLFFVGMIGVVGLPPLAGFLGKALILAATPLDARGVWLWSITLGCSLLALLAASRAGSLVFWNTADVGAAPPQRRTAWRATPIVALLGVVVLLAVLAAPAARYTTAAAAQLLAPADYVSDVLTAR